MARPSRRPVAPLYDPAFEHDACGIGFVADAGGRNRGRVLELALARAGGARAIAARSGPTASRATAPGSCCRWSRRSSRSWPGPRRGERPAIAMLFLPRGPATGRAGAGAGRRGAGDGRRSRSRRGDASRSTPSPSAPRLPTRSPTSSRRSSRARWTRRPAARSRMPSSSDASSSPAAGSSRRPARRVSTTCRSRRCRAGPSSTRASSPAAAWRRSTRTSPARSR